MEYGTYQKQTEKSIDLNTKIKMKSKKIKLGNKIKVIYF